MPKVLQYRIAERSGRSLANPEHGRHGLRDQIGLGQGRELDEPRAILESRERRRGHLQRQARLAAPAGAGQRQQTRRCEQPLNLPTRDRDRRSVIWSGRLWRRNLVDVRALAGAPVSRFRFRKSTNSSRADSVTPLDLPFPGTCGWTRSSSAGTSSLKRAIASGCAWRMQVEGLDVGASSRTVAARSSSDTARRRARTDRSGGPCSGRWLARGSCTRQSPSPRPAW